MKADHDAWSTINGGEAEMREAMGDPRREDLVDLYMSRRDLVVHWANGRTVFSTVLDDTLRIGGTTIITKGRMECIMCYEHLSIHQPRRWVCCQTPRSGSAERSSAAPSIMLQP